MDARRTCALADSPCGADRGRLPAPRIGHGVREWDRSSRQRSCARLQVQDRPTNHFDSVLDATTKKGEKDPGAAPIDRGRATP
jgi:hypothetical protein